MSQRRLGAGALCLAMVGGVGLLAAPSASAAPATIHTAGFEAGLDGWAARGTATIAPTTAEHHSGASSLAVTGRTQAWNGPGLNANGIMPAGEYDLEAWVKLPAGSGADKVTLSAARTPAGGTTAYDSVAYEVPVSDAGWTKVGGHYSIGTANSALELYLESPDATQDFYVDDVTIVGEAAAPVAPGTAANLTTDFESGLQGWGPRGTAQVALSTTGAHAGTTSLSVTNRAQSWQGPAIDVTENVAIGVTVDVSVWAKLATGQAPKSLKVSVQRDRAGAATGYDNVAGASAVVSADAWAQLKGTYTLGAAVDKATLYVEGDANVDFSIDDLVMAPRVDAPIQDVPALKDVLGAQGFEHVSTAIDSRETVGRPSKLYTKQFNSFSPENDGKPESTEPTKGNFTFGNLDRLLDFADANNVEVYGHVLFWHSQTPDWVFQDDVTHQWLTNSPEDQATLLAHMEEHVKGIADHVNARYAASGKTNPIWAWDVANETIDDSANGNAHDMRNSRYYQVLGESWVAKGFAIADRYFPDQKLFLNDYNTEMPTKRADYLELIGSLEKAGAPIDGVGHQAHVDFSRPIEWLDASLTAVEELDPTLLQAVTELDVSDSAENNGADVSAGTVPQHRPGMADQAERETEVGYYYRDLFSMLRKHSGSLESVTFWGLDNARSWLRTWPAARPWEAPLPFGDDLEAKPAYWGIVDPSKLAPRPSDQLAPRIAGHDTVRALSTSVRGATVTYTVEAGDTRDGAVTPVCTPPSGSLFPIGTTKVTCTATDEAGNQANPVTFDVVVTPPATTTALYSAVNHGTVVQAKVGKDVKLVVELGNKGSGTLVGSTFAYSCTQTSGKPMTLTPAPGSAQQVGSRDYPAGQSAEFQLRGTPTQTGTATFDCTLTMTDSFGAEVTSTNTVTVDVRK